MSPYEVLGVRVGASIEEIRRAYLLLARQHHPDFHTGESARSLAAAGRQMQEINEAWAALSDPAVRRRYEGDLADTFRPFRSATDDDADPREAPDVPYRPVRPPSAVERSLVLIPVGLFAVAGVCAAVAMATGVLGLLVVSVVAFVLSCVGFLVVPLLALGRAAKDEG